MKYKIIISIRTQTVRINFYFHVFRDKTLTSRNKEITDRCCNKTAYEYDTAGTTTKVIYNSNGQMVAEKWYDKDNTLTARYKYVHDGQGNQYRTLH